MPDNPETAAVAAALAEQHTDRDFDHVHSGKVREIFADKNGGTLVLVATDRISAYDKVMKERIPGKGKVLNLMSAFWFDWFEDVPNHLIDSNFLPEGEFAGRASLVQRTSPIPMECIVRWLITGSMWSAFKKADEVDGIKVVQGIEVPASMQESETFPEPLFTPSTKAEVGHDEALTEEEARALLMRWDGEDRFDLLKRYSTNLFEQARDYARERGIILADTKTEWGLHEGGVLLIDEIFTPDSSRFSFVEDYEVGQKLVCQDKQILRDWLDEQGWDRESPPPALPDELIERIKGVYTDMYERITGNSLPV